MRSFCLTAALLSLSSVSNALTSTLQQITGFTAGPTSAGMYMYIPTTKLALAPIIVAIHWCSGSANDYFAGTGYANYADTYGYIVIYPDSPSTDNCWDVASLASLTHNGGGDSLTIINMVRYAVANYGGDINRVYASGLSSGAMMTNVLSGAYPDIIKAGVIYSGVPDGCFYVSTAVAGQATASWNSTCSTGVSSQSAVAWGNLVRSYYPGYTGSYPRLNIYHGTSDFTLAYPLLAEELKEWSNVHGISFASNVTDTPLAGYTKMVYGDGTKLLGFSALNVGHSVPIRTEDDLVWFGLMPGPFYPSSSSTVVGTSTTSKTSSSTKATTTMTTSSKVSTSSSKASSSSTKASTTLVTITTTTSSAAVSTSGIPQWGACGGNPWTGSTTCASPYTCVFFSIWYSQCQ